MERPGTVWSGTLALSDASVGGQQAGDIEIRPRGRLEKIGIHFLKNKFHAVPGRSIPLQAVPDARASLKVSRTVPGHSGTLVLARSGPFRVIPGC